MSHGEFKKFLRDRKYKFYVEKRVFEASKSDWTITLFKTGDIEIKGNIPYDEQMEIQKFVAVLVERENLNKDFF